MGSLNPLIFPLPESVLGNYADDPLNTGLFDDDLNLVLPIQREDYVPQDNSESGVVIGWQRSFINYTFAHYQFEATSRDSRQTVYYVLKALQSLSESTSIGTGNYTLITVRDYHNDWDYKSQSRSLTGYVDRQGVIKVSLQNGSFTESRIDPTLMKWGGGVKINFTEILF